jgi:hypothetical protein
MKSGLLIFCLLLAFLVTFSSCTRLKTSEPAIRGNVDSVFITNWLPQLRDAYCADTLTLHHIKRIFTGSCSKFKYGITLCIDSTDSVAKHCHTQINVYLDSLNHITSIQVSFPPYEYYKSVFVRNEQMVALFGPYHAHPIPIKDGSRGEYGFGTSCSPQKLISGYLNCDNSVRSITMSLDYSTDSLGNTIDLKGHKIQ